MDEGVYLVCEALGVSVNDAVAAADVCVLYEKVVRRPTSPCLTQNAISQVTGTNGGKSCSAGKVLEVLMEMEKERKRKEELYWDNQLLRAAESAMSLPITPCCQHKQTKGKWCPCIWKLKVKAKQLSIRLALEGPWNVLPSLRYGNQTARKEWPQPSSSMQIPLLLQRKYDIIRERLYAEMLHEEHGALWWESLSPGQREECVSELGVLVERALSDRDLMALCDLPGAFRIYRHQVPLEVSSEEKGKLREQLQLAFPQEQIRLAHPQDLAWTALLFLMELESCYQEESRALNTLMTRADQAVLCEVCVCLRSAVTKAQRETHSHAALLTARQNWEKWPNVNTDVRVEHLSPLIRQRDQHQDTDNIQYGLDESNQERQAEPPSSQNNETSMDNGDQLLIEETPYLEILCVRSQCDGQPEEPIGEEEEQDVEKQGSLIAAAWSDICEPANQDSPLQSPLDQDQYLDSEEDTSEETQSQTDDPQTQHTPTKYPPQTHAPNAGNVEPCAKVEDSVCAVCIDQESVCDEEDEEEEEEEEEVCVQQQQQESVCVEGVDETQEGVCEEKQQDACAGGVCEEETAAGVCVASACVCGESVCVCVPPEGALEREETMRSLVDMQRKLELRYQRERERHTLRIQERLTIIQNRKSDDDLLGITDLSAFTKEEDEQIQKMLVRERLEQLRRERSYILQTRRERNTAGFKELLGPTAQHTLRTED